MMWYGTNGWEWVHWLLMVVGHLVFWGAIIAAVVLVVHYLVGQRDTAASPLSSRARAEDVLAERFGRGEIDANEYQHRLALLQQQAAEAPRYP